MKLVRFVVTAFFVMICGFFALIMFSGDDDNSASRPAVATDSGVSEESETVRVSTDESDASMLELALLVVRDIDVSSLEVVDGRANGGERSAIVAFTSDDDFEGIGSVMGAIAAATREFEIDLDAIVMITGPDTDTVSMMASVQVDDVLDFQDEKISAETLFERIDITQ